MPQCFGQNIRCKESLKQSVTLEKFKCSGPKLLSRKPADFVMCLCSLGIYLLVWFRKTAFWAHPQQLWLLAQQLGTCVSLHPWKSNSYLKDMLIAHPADWGTWIILTLLLEDIYRGKWPSFTLFKTEYSKDHKIHEPQGAWPFYLFHLLL